MPSPLDLSPGARVAVLVPGSPEYVVVVIGLLERGIVPVPLDPALTVHERQERLGYVRASAVVEDVDELQALAARIDITPHTLPRARPMHLTSGTTGSPKGVWSGVLDDASALALVQEERELWRFSPDDVHLVMSPLHHSAPLRFAMVTLLAGGRLVVPGPFDTDVVTAAIREHRPTTTFCVPTHLHRLFAAWDRGGTPDLSSFRLVAHAGAACPEPVKRRLIDTFPAGTTWEFYGATEGQFTACRSEEWLRRPGTVGRARPGRRLSIDPDGTVWCAVPDHARFRYFDGPEKTAAAWRVTDDGAWFTVGDHGRLDEDGYLYLDGRREDLIITGGVNVYPAEVEGVLAAHPKVQQVAVYGVPDPEWGARVCAAVVGDADEAELRELARERLAPAKRPKQYRFPAALPLTATGKIRRREAGRPGLASDADLGESLRDRVGDLHLAVGVGVQAVIGVGVRRRPVCHEPHLGGGHHDPLAVTVEIAGEFVVALVELRHAVEGHHRNVHQHHVDAGGGAPEVLDHVPHGRGHVRRRLVLREQVVDPELDHHHVGAVDPSQRAWVVRRWCQRGTPHRRVVSVEVGSA